MQCNNSLPYLLQAGNAKATVSIPGAAEHSFAPLSPASVMPLYLQALDHDLLCTCDFTDTRLFPVFSIDAGQHDRVLWLKYTGNTWTLHLDTLANPPLPNLLGRALDVAEEKGWVTFHHHLYDLMRLQIAGLNKARECQGFMGSPQSIAYWLQAEIFFNFLRGEQGPGHRKPCTLHKHAQAARLTLDAIKDMLRHASSKKPRQLTWP